MNFPLRLQPHQALERPGRLLARHGRAPRAAGRSTAGRVDARRQRDRVALPRAGRRHLQFKSQRLALHADFTLRRTQTLAKPIRERHRKSFQRANWRSWARGSCGAGRRSCWASSSSAPGGRREPSSVGSPAAIRRGVWRPNQSLGSPSSTGPNRMPPRSTGGLTSCLTETSSPACSRRSPSRRVRGDAPASLASRNPRDAS
jgi:hypothetical protein